MRDYAKWLKQHLSEYRVQRFGVTELGIWKRNGRHYPHILPERFLEMNILETCRKEFWAYFRSRRGITLHPGFHHLNSSQAMCFNLFFPFFGLPEIDPKPFLAELGVQTNQVRTLGFEGILDEAEGTNLGFYWQLSSGQEYLFEIKLSKGGFGGGGAPRRLSYFRDIRANMDW